MENRDKGIRGARLEIVLKEGRRLEKTVLIPKGDPENPFTLEDVKNKLYTCSCGLLDREKADILVESVMKSGRDIPFSPKSFFGVEI